MVNEIKLDKAGMPYTKVVTPETKVKQDTLADAKEADVTVTNHMDKFIKLVNSYDMPEQRAMGLEQIKTQIKNNSYRVNLDTLSEKLINSGILIVGG